VMSLNIYLPLERLS